jgi:hypothetical protein
MIGWHMLHECMAIITQDVPYFITEAVQQVDINGGHGGA